MQTPPTGVVDKGRPEAIKAVPVRHPGRWVAMAVVAVLAAMLIHALVANPKFQWDVVGDNLFNDNIVRGTWMTLKLTFIAMLMGLVGGIILAVMRLSPNPVLSTTSWLYIWIFRGTPVLVQLLFWGFIGALWEELSIGIPFGPEFASEKTNDLIPMFAAALLGLGLNEAAYMAEIVRAGILSVDEGQSEAAQALGMSRAKTMRRIVLPQAMRVIIPPTGNETISMLKSTSLVATIAVEELLRAGQNIYARTYENIPILIVVSIWYLFFTSVLTVGQYYLERHFARGANRQLPLTPLQKLRRFAGDRGAASRTTPVKELKPPIPPGGTGTSGLGGR